MTKINVDLSEYGVGEGSLSGAYPAEPGWYEAKVFESDVKKKDSETIVRLWFAIDDVDPPQWYDFFLGNEFDEINLVSIAYCLGHKQPNRIIDSSELHGLSCQLLLAPSRKGSFPGTITIFNDIVGFKPCE